MTPARITTVVLLVVAAVLTGCEVSISTANISDAKIAKDPDGNQPATVFAPNETFYCVVKLENAPEGTKVEAVWIAVEAAGVTDHEIDRTTIEHESGTIKFNLTKDGVWPPGKYKVDLYLDGDLDRSLPFEVAAGG